MKKIIALLLALAMCFALVACGETTNEPNVDDNAPVVDTPAEDNTPAEVTYTVALAVDTAFGKNNKVSNTALMLVLDADNKIVAARVDCAEATPALDEAGALVPQENVASKVEKGDAYTGMNAGSWAQQSSAFEAWLVGKTADEIAATEFTNELIAGCTMTSSLATFKALVAEAFASELKVTFTTSEAVTSGIAFTTAVKSGKGGKITVSSDVAAVVLAGDKIAAAIIDTIEQSYTVEEGALVAAELKASKNEQGEGYTGMPAGAWYKQAAVFCNATVGLTAAELEAFEPVSDALAAAGCTMQNTPAGYKATMIKAVSYAK